MGRSNVPMILNTDFADEKAEAVSTDAHCELTIAIYKFAVCSSAVLVAPWPRVTSMSSFLLTFRRNLPGCYSSVTTQEI